VQPKMGQGIPQKECKVPQYEPLTEKGIQATLDKHNIDWPKPRVLGFDMVCRALQHIQTFVRVSIYTRLRSPSIDRPGPRSHTHTMHDTPNCARSECPQWTKCDERGACIWAIAAHKLNGPRLNKYGMGGYVEPKNPKQAQIGRFYANLPEGYCKIPGRRWHTQLEQYV